MDFSLNLPFSTVLFKNFQKKHKEYFDELFFKVPKFDTKIFYTLEVNLKNITLPKNDLYYLEEDIAANNKNIYIFDTQKNVLQLNFSTFNEKRISLQVDLDFDLYFLYNHVIEPLLIIWGAKHGLMYLHSSCVEKKGKAIVLAAWTHTGKTSSIFSLKKDRVRFLGDDFSVLYNSIVYSYPKSINIFSYNFESYPWLYKTLGFPLRTRIKFSVLIKRFLHRLSQSFDGTLSKILFRLSELAEISTNTRVYPEQLGLESVSFAPIGKVILLIKSKESSMLEKLTNSESVTKMLSIIKYEVRDFLNIYLKYKFIYPKLYNTIIENFESNYSKSYSKNIKNSFQLGIPQGKDQDATIGKKFLSWE